jgi:hypothetical protein
MIKIGALVCLLTLQACRRLLLVLTKGNESMMRYCLLIVAALLVVNAQADDLPPAFRADYIIKKGPFELGRSSRELSYGDNGELVFRADSQSTGLVSLFYTEKIAEVTRMKQVDGRVVPVEYQYRRDGRRKRTISQQFDWASGHVTSRVNDTVYEFALQEHALDQSGYQVNLMIDLEKGLRDISYPIARKNKMRVYEISHVGDERIETVLGAINTVVIQRKEDKVTTMWCAPDLHYLPVKIQHEEDGSVFTAYLHSLAGMRPDTMQAPVSLNNNDN